MAHRLQDFNHPLLVDTVTRLISCNYMSDYHTFAYCILFCSKDICQFLSSFFSPYFTLINNFLACMYQILKNLIFTFFSVYHMHFIFYVLYACHFLSIVCISFFVYCMHFIFCLLYAFHFLCIVCIYLLDS